MQKILAFILTIAILFLTLYNSCKTAEASDFVVATETPVGITPVPVATSVPLGNGNYNGAVYAAANVLTWEMLQTFLYSVAGQQAYDTYANDKEAQEELYADYCDWWETTKKGTAMGFVGLVYMADGVTQGTMKLSTQANDVYSYYKTAGSSALQEVKDEAYKQWQVIKGGLKENGNEPQTSPTPTPDKEATKIIGISGIGTLIGCVGGYIKDLVEGKRGEVSNKFNHAVSYPRAYFDGNYNIVDGYYSYNIMQTNRIFTEDYGYLYSGGNVTLRHPFNENSIYPALLLKPGTTVIDGISYDDIRLYERNLKTYPLTESGNSKLANTNSFGSLGNIVLDSGSYYGLDVREAFVHIERGVYNVKGIPIFSNMEDIKYYWLTGNASRALNYFKATTFNPPNTWLDYKIAAIAAQLPQILQALTTLPTITTESLTGFATAVSAGINANLANIQAMTQAQLQQFMSNLNTEAAKKVVTEELAEENPYEEEWDFENITPMPTLAPDIIEKQNNGKMIVDLSKFFPFCVPYDMIRLVKVLNATPKAPRFETSIKYTALGINEKIVLDLARFDDVAKTVRLCETVLFVLALILITRNLIRG